MQFIQKYLLKVRLARVIKTAEHHLERGVEHGDKVYLDLFNDANILIRNYSSKHPGFDWNKEVPAYADLERLTVSPTPTNMKQVLGLVGVGTFAVITAIGCLAASINVSYHGWLNLFHLIHRLV